MRSLSVVLIAVFFVVPAYAQSEKTEFDGAKIEAIGGYSSEFDSKEFVYGGAIGYDLSTNGIVVGVEAGLTGTSGDRNGAGLRSSAGRDFNIGGRVGVAVTPKTLLYGKVGYTNTRSSFESIRAGQIVKSRDTRNGAYFGGGIEQVVVGRAYVKGEYRYSTSPGNGRNQVLGGIGIRF